MYEQRRIIKSAYDARKYRDLDNEDVYVYLKKCNEDRLFRNKKILDFGCGFGGKDLFIYMKYRPKELLGIDLSERNIKYAKEIEPEKQNILKFKNLDICNIQEKNYFDTIISFTVFEHIEKQYALPILDKMAELIIEDGIIVIVFNHYNDRFGTHLREYIYHPWPQTIFDEEILFNYWNKKLLEDNNFTEDSYFPKLYKHGMDKHNQDCFMNLNKINVDQFLRIINKSNLRLIAMYHYTAISKIYKLLKIFPFIPKKYLEGSAVYYLMK